MNPAVVLPKNKTKAFAAQGIVDSSACEGTREGEDFQRERLQLKIQYYWGTALHPGSAKGV